MIDMLVNLYDLPLHSDTLSSKLSEQFLVRKPLIIEIDMLHDWVRGNFSINWANEVQKALSSHPITCWVAQSGNDLIGFACYETTAKGFFGPTGVLESFRGKGIGEVLLYKSLESLKEMGYAYAIIGGVGPIDYYKQKVNAKIIEGSEVGIYSHRLRRKKE